MHTKVKERHSRSATRATGEVGRVGQSWAELGSIGQSAHPHLQEDRDRTCDLRGPECDLGGTKSVIWGQRV